MAGQDSLDASAEFVSEYGVDVIEHLFDDGDIWQRFGIASQPAWVFLNDDGTFETKLGSLGPSGIATEIANLEAR